METLYKCHYNDRMMCEMLLPCGSCKTFTSNKSIEKFSYDKALSIVCDRKVCGYCCASQEKCKQCVCDIPTNFVGRKLVDVGLT